MDAILLEDPRIKMDGEAILSEIENRVREAAGAFVEQILAHDASTRKAVEKGSCHLTINSSFIFREKSFIKTDQSQERLVLRLADKDQGGFKPECLGVSTSESMKSHHRLSKESPPELIPIHDAVRGAVNNFGNLIFVLLGMPAGLRGMAEKVSGSTIRELRLDPALAADIVRLEPEVIAIKKLVAIEDLLASIEADSGPLVEADRQSIARAYDAVLDGATTDVAIPFVRLNNAGATILGNIASSLRTHADAYQSALRELGNDDSGALNDVLRIAYNFTADAMPLIFLFVSICDLKPIVFWCTVDKQWALYRSFAALPWSALGRKEKLADYQKIVAEARNQAFHHLLPFDSTIEVDLSRSGVRAERIRLFCPFGSKDGRGVRLQDQDLADVLANFSRAKQRPVSRQFWAANAKVMEAAADLATGMVETLLLIHNSRIAEDSATRT